MKEVNSYYYTEQEEKSLIKKILILARSRDLVWYLSPIKREVYVPVNMPRKIMEELIDESEKQNERHRAFFRYVNIITPFPKDLASLAETQIIAERHGWGSVYDKTSLEGQEPFEKFKKETLRTVDLAVYAGNHAWEILVKDKRKTTNPFKQNPITMRFSLCYRCSRDSETRQVVAAIRTDRITKSAREKPKTNISFAILSEKENFVYGPEGLYYSDDMVTARLGINEIFR